MRDFNELKRLAEDCIRQCDDGGKFTDALKLMQQHAGPVEILALIASVEKAREPKTITLPDRYAEMYQEYFDDVDGGCFNAAKYLADVKSVLEATGLKVKP